MTVCEKEGREGRNGGVEKVFIWKVSVMEKASASTY